MRNNREKKNLILIICALVIFAGFFVASLIIDNRDAGESYRVPDYEHDGKYYLKKDNLKLILFVGIDSYDRQESDSYRNDHLADSIVLLALDSTNKTITPIQISRDTMCNYSLLGVGGKYAGEDYGQIALSHSYGSGGIDSLVNVKDAVSKLLTGIEIDEYFSVTMDAVSIVNDDCGGIDVYVEDDFSSIEPELIQGQVNTLKGSQALSFVRSRMGLEDSSNTNRMNRQKVYLKALYEKCKELVNSDSDFIAKTFNDISAYLVSSCDIYGLSDLGNEMLEYTVLDSVKPDSTITISDKGYVQELIDETKLIDLCIDTFYKEMEFIND